MKLIQGMYCAIRKTDGKEWFDYSTCSVRKDHAERMAKEFDLSLPTWCCGNKVVRIACIKIEEVSE